MLKKIYRLRKKEDGQAVVEFALVLPILLLVVLGIMEFGWLFYGNIVITSAAREGARTTAILAGDGVIDNVNNDNGDEKRIIKAINDHLSNTSISPSSISITINNGAPTTIPSTKDITVPAESEIKVIVKGNMTPIVGLFVSNPTVLQKDATMRRE